MKLPFVRRSKIDDAVKAECEACAVLASHFTIKPSASIYPDMPFQNMNETAKTASHTTAQQIAWEIRDRHFPNRTIERG